MAMSEIIKQLESLAEHCGSMIDKEEPEDIWKADVEALNQAIEKLQGECVGTLATTNLSIVLLLKIQIIFIFS